VESKVINSSIEELQKKLNYLGFNCGKPDGVNGSKTRSAIMAFQEQYFVDGKIDLNTMISIDEAYESWSDRKNKIYLRIPRGIDEVVETFGDIEFVESRRRGYIKIINNWVEENIVEANLGFVGTHKCHFLMVPIFEKVFNELENRGLDKEVLSFAGIWSARHKMHNPKRSLSTHSWGIACDINPSTNMPGIVGDMHPGIVETFEEYGFNWGGRWRHRDDMHFQYCTGF